MGRPDSARRSVASFATLEERTCYVSEAAVKKRWKRLSPISQENIRDVLMSVRRQSHKEKRRGKHVNDNADALIEEVVTRLNDRLPRMPFPPGTNDETFDFETNINRVEGIEQQLTDDTYAMNLLRTQIKKEEQLLQRDKEEAKQLQESLRANDALRKKQSKSLHPVAHKTNQQSVSSKNLDSSTVSDVANLSHDPSISPIIQQLQDHLATMQSNTTSMESIITTMGTVGHLLHLVAGRQSPEEEHNTNDASAIT